MVLPANYNRILYKFRPPDLDSEKEFMKIKSYDKTTYQKKIKLRIKKEQLIYIRHHWLNLFTYFFSTIIVLAVLTYFIIEQDLKLFLDQDSKYTGFILLFIFLISFFSFCVYHLKGFPGSLYSFLKYKSEKFNYFRLLKDRIDKCENFYSYKEKYLKR